MREIKLIFDNDTLDRYATYYFEQHPRAKKKPIPHPYHPSINEWMIMKRPMMNALKGKWKSFIEWFVASQGCSNLHIERCELAFYTYYYTNRPHDNDNSVPKFLIDGLVSSGMIVNDDNNHITKLILESGVDTQRPRTEITFTIYD